MIKLSTAQLWVHDQDQALEFYTKKLGMEVRSDVTVPELGNFRWLTVGPPGQPDISIVLMAIPGPPVMDPATAEQVRALMAKGFAGTVFFTTDDVHADYELLQSRGVEFSEAPEERPYGIDSGFHDPSGDSFRLTQVRSCRHSDPHRPTMERLAHARGASRSRSRRRSASRGSPIQVENDVDPDHFRPSHRRAGLSTLWVWRSGSCM